MRIKEKKQKCSKCGEQVTEDNFALKIKEKYYCVECIDRIITIVLTIMGLTAVATLSVLVH